MKPALANTPCDARLGHPALLPLQRAARALEQGDLAAARQQLGTVSQQLAARATWLEDDLRRRYETLAARFSDHARRLSERLAAQHPPATSGSALTHRLAAPDADPAVVPSGHPSAHPTAPGAHEPGHEEGLLATVCAEPLRQLLHARFVLPLRHPQQAARYRQQAGGGLLLFGPPGTGKTHLVRTLAQALAVPVFSLSPAEVLSKWLGDSEKHLAEVFAKARQLPAALVFIDEIDVLAPRRDAMGAESGGPLQRLMAQLLGELDGFHTGGRGQLLFLGATNRPWALDEALLRPGRFDALAWMGLPNAAARETLLRRALQSVPVDPQLQWQAAAAALQGRSVAQTLACAKQAAQQAFGRALQQGIDAPVRTDDLLGAAQRTVACLQADDMNAFKAFAARHAVVGLDDDGTGQPGTGSDRSPTAAAPAAGNGGAWPDTAGTVSNEDRAAVFEPVRFVQARDLHVEVETLPFLSYALQHAGLGPVRQLSLSNQGSEDSQNLLVEVALVPSDLGEPWNITLPALPAGQTWSSGPLALPLRLDRLRAVAEKEQAHLRITVRDRDEVLLARTESLPVLAYNEWVYLPKFLQLTAAYVQPNSVALHPVVQAAARRLAAATGSASFSGYQVGGAARAEQMLLALHDTLAQDVALDYINPPPSFEQSGQKIRLVADTLAQGRGTCLDLAILQAALWEHIGLQPVLVLVPGHAMLACWMQEAPADRAAVTTVRSGRGGKAALALQEALNAGHLRLFNSVEVAHRADLAAAEQQGLQILRSVLQDGHELQFIDIAACRAAVTPLP